MSDADVDPIASVDAVAALDTPAVTSTLDGGSFAEVAAVADIDTPDIEGSVDNLQPDGIVLAAAIGTPDISADLTVPVPETVTGVVAISPPNVHTEINSTADEAAVAVGRVMRSRDDVVAVQFATVETPAIQRLHDDEFRDPDLVAAHWDDTTRWHRVGEGTTVTYLQNVTKVRIERSVHAQPVFSIPPSGLVSRPVHQVFASRSASQLAADDLANSIGGFESEQVATHDKGRIWAAVRFTALTDLGAPLLLQIIGSDGTVLQEKSISAVQGQTVEEFIGYTIGDANRHTFNYPEFAPRSLVDRPMHRVAHPDELDVFTIPPLPPVRDDLVRVRIVQKGLSEDAWELDALSLFEDAVVWEFSNDGGTNFVPAPGIRNNPSGVLQFPRGGNALVWRATSYLPRVHVNAIQVRPWYRSTYRTRALAQRWGPTISGFDQFPQIQDDPMFRQWDKPIPRTWWLAGKSFPALPIVGHPTSNEFNTFVGRLAEEDISADFDDDAVRTVFLKRGAHETIPTVSDVAERLIVIVRGVNEDIPVVQDDVTNFIVPDGDGPIISRPFNPLENLTPHIDATVTPDTVACTTRSFMPQVSGNQAIQAITTVEAIAAVPAPTVTTVEDLVYITSDDFGGTQDAQMVPGSTNAALGGSTLALQTYTGGSGPAWARNVGGSGKGNGGFGFQGGHFYPVFLTVNASTADHQSEFVVATVPGGGFEEQIGCSVRQGNAAYTGYFLLVDGTDSNKIKLVKATGFDPYTAWTLLGTYAIASNGDKLRLSAKGSTLKVYINDVLTDTVTDSTYATQTYAGIWTRMVQSIKADNWAVYES